MDLVTLIGMRPLDYQKTEDADRENWTRLRLKLFGPSRSEVWQALARETGAEFKKGSFWNGRDKVVVEIGPWLVTLDTFVVSTGKSTVVYTRMRAPYVNADGFRFSVRRRNFFDGLAEAMGFHDIEVGHREFDEAFIIKGTSEEKLRLLFSNPRMRELISAQKNIHFQVRDDEGWFRQKFPEGVDELIFTVVGVIKDIDRLKRLFDLFAETLHTLCHIGSAYENDPGIVLG